MYPVVPSIMLINIDFISSYLMDKLFLFPLTTLQKSLIFWNGEDLNQMCLNPTSDQQSMSVLFPSFLKNELTTLQAS